MMADQPVIFDTSLETFDKDVIQASKSLPILVDFWADWCAPCIAIEPVLVKVVSSYNGRIHLARLEVDAGDNMKLAGQHQIRGFPSILLFQSGEAGGRFTGSQPTSMIEAFIRKHTGLSPTP